MLRSRSTVTYHVLHQPTDSADKLFQHGAKTLRPSIMLPSTKTFAIPELLEMILEHSTPQDLLLWQRVNKIWRAAIQGSPLIQEKLSFRVNVCKDEHEVDRALWNPLFHFSRLLPSQSQIYINDQAFDGKADYPTASLKQMLITSPAVTKLKFLIFGRWCQRTEWIGSGIVNEAGITIGEVADVRRKFKDLGGDEFEFERLVISKRPD